MTAEVPAPAVPTLHGPDAERPRDGRGQTLVWDALRQVLAARMAETGRSVLDIVDAGGGTGGFAVPFAVLGHNVTVVDPSPDSLAGARRRAAERNVRLTAVQGDADSLDAVAGRDTADLVICHSVLEYVDEPASAMSAIARVLRPGATVSVLASNAVAAVLQRALAGKYSEASDLLEAASGDCGADGVTRPGEPRRFTLAGLASLLSGAGLRAGDAHGIRVFSGLLPAAETDPDAAEVLLGLEDAAAAHPALRDIAAHLHIVGVRP